MSKKRYRILATAYDEQNKPMHTCFNSYTKTHPIQAYFAKKVGAPEKMFLHAEIRALLKAKGKRVKHLHIQNTNGGSSRPCSICIEACKAYGVESVAYYDEKGEYCQMKVQDMV